jgi:transposase
VGHTPVITAKFNWKRLSMAGAVAYSPDSTDAAVVFQTKAGAYNDESLTVFLDELRKFLGGARVTLLWDGLPSHRSRLMNDYLLANRSWLVVERLPAYAPDLNPVEALSGNLKGTELANRYVETVEQVEAIAHDGAARIGEDTELALACLRHTGLSR